MQYVFSVAAGILPAVEPGILPGGMGVWFEKSLPFRTSGPGGKMPPSTAAKMAAATDVNPTLDAYVMQMARPPEAAVNAESIVRGPLPFLSRETLLIGSANGRTGLLLELERRFVSPRPRPWSSRQQPTTIPQPGHP